jgi:hypothetical protein
VAYTCPSCAMVFVNPAQANAQACDSCKADACDQCGAECSDGNCLFWLCRNDQIECGNCHKAFCSKHIEDCLNCGALYCNGCIDIRACNSCQQDTCGKCGAQCQECHGQFCSADIIPCPVCNTHYCDDCSEFAMGCALCAEDGCAACLKKCGICEQIYCANCLRQCTQCKLDVCRGHALVFVNNPNRHCQNCVDTILAVKPQLVACERAIVDNVDDAALGYFDPPLELFSYSRASKEPKPNTIQSWQAEHPIPNSCFINGKGRTGPTVPHAGKYAEGKALCFWVEDDQSQGTEHKFITDFERDISCFCLKRGEYPLVEQWFQYMEYGWKEMILGFRKYKGPQGNTQSDTDNLREAFAAKAAQALRVKLQSHYFKTLKIDDKKCRTKIGFNPWKVPPAKPKAKQQFTGF